MIYLYVSQDPPDYRVDLVWKEIDDDQIETLGQYTIGAMEMAGLVGKFTRDYVMGTASFLPCAVPFGFAAIYTKGNRDHVRRILVDAGIDGRIIPFR